MKIAKEIIEYLEKMFPTDTAMEFDNVGLLVGRLNHKVNKIIVMLDADKDTIAEAISEKADMIITHHPLLMSPVSKIDNENILQLIENRVCLYSAHTNLDQGENGVNENLIKTLGANNIKRVTLPSENFSTYIGTLEKMSLTDAVLYVKEKLNIKNARYVGYDQATVSKIAVVGGSGCSFIDDVKNLGCDTLITSDMKYHQAQYAQSIGLNIIDAGHFETENLICNVLQNILKKQFDDLEIVVSKRKNSYIKYG